MAAITTRYHKTEEEHETYSTHVCFQCGMHFRCEGEPHTPATPEACPVPSEFTCADCFTNIRNAKFQFGDRREGCHDGCDRTNGIFRHDRMCRWYPTRGWNKALPGPGLTTE